MRFILFITLGLLVACGGSEPPPLPPAAMAPPAVAKQQIAITTTNVKFDDTDQYDWTSTRPWRYPIHGIDVSKFQGDIDWVTAQQSGVNFAFIKATEGGDHLDKNFSMNWNAAKGAGVLRGAYHFYYFCRTASEQANWFIQNVPNDPAALPPVLDMEWNHRSRNCRYRPGPAKVRNEIRIYLDRLTAHYGKRPIIYVTPDFYAENNLARIRGYDFWLRSVADHPREVYRGQHWVFWQYSGTGVVPGIEGNVDINVFSGSVSTWRTWVDQNTEQPVLALDG